MIDTLQTAAKGFANGEVYIVAGSTEEGVPALSYQGDRKQLTVLFRLIRDTLRDDEGIGNHPNRRDVRQRKEGQN